MPGPPTPREREHQVLAFPAVPETRADELTALIRRCSRGDEAAFAELYDRTAPRVHGVVLSVVRAPDLAVEVCQEVYVEAWRQSARHDPHRGSVITWLTTMAHRRAVDRVRSTERERERDHRWVAENGGRDVDDTWSATERSLDAQRVRHGLDALTELQREALTLAYFGGYTHAEVAGLLGVPLGTVKSRLRDGLIKMRDMLGGIHE